MRDTANASPGSVIPRKGTAIVAAYSNGRYANYEAARRQFNHVESISVAGRGRARFYDVENGDYSPTSPDLIANLRADKADGYYSYLYLSLSTWATMRATLRAAGLLDWQGNRYWIAWYQTPPKAIIPRGALACQYLGSPGNSHGPYDESVIRFYCPGIDSETSFRATIARLRARIRRLKRKPH